VALAKAGGADARLTATRLTAGIATPIPVRPYPLWTRRESNNDLTRSTSTWPTMRPSRDTASASSAQQQRHHTLQRRAVAHRVVEQRQRLIGRLRRQREELR
jgi:hypothetical protein